MLTFIKFRLGEVTRKTGYEVTSWQQVKDLISKMFAEKANEMSIFYEDVDSEKIELSDENDWKVCVEEFQNKALQENSQVCNIVILIEHSSLLINEEYLKLLNSQLDSAENSQASGL